MWSPSFLSILLLLCVVGSSDSFTPSGRGSCASTMLMGAAPKSNGGANVNNANAPVSSNADSSSSSEDVTLQANTRFSAFAPDSDLDTGDFRATLMENMKADLERRRRESPNRGNQPAKNYLDSL